MNKYVHERIVEYQVKCSPHRFSFKRRSEKSGDIRGSLVPVTGTLGQKLKSICLEYHRRQCMIVSSGLKMATSRNEPTKLWKGNVSSRICLSTGGGPMWSLPRMHWTSLYRPPRPCPHTGPCPLVYTGPWSIPGQDWKPVQTCSLEDLTVQPSPNADIWWMPTETCAVAKREVSILMECFLVLSSDNVTQGYTNPLRLNKQNQKNRDTATSWKTKTGGISSQKHFKKSLFC